MCALDQTVQQQLAEADKHGEGPSSYQDYNTNTAVSPPSNVTSEFSGNTQGFGSAIQAGMVERI